MNDAFDTGFDPYETLMQCQHNVAQCALAINTGSELMKDLGRKYQQQQELIKQLAYQNAKLLEITDNLSKQVTEQAVKIELMKINEDLSGTLR